MTDTSSRGGLGRHIRAPFAALLLAFTAPTPLTGQQPDLQAVLAKAAERAAGLADPSRILVCTEEYKQQLERIRSIVGFEGAVSVGSRSEVAAVGMDTRTWVAELAVFPTPANEGAGYPWREFRDIISVNGKALREGPPRLANLASVPPDVAGVTALGISQGAASQLFGRLVRAVDIPRAAPLFLHASNQKRFEFKKGGQKTIGGVKALEIRFKETAKPTIIRASGDKDAPSTGSFFVDPSTGDVVSSVLKSQDSPEIYDELTVTYATVPGLGLCLPAALTERIVDEPAAQRVQATATFTNWQAVPRRKD